MTPTDATNNQNICVELLRLHLHINNQATDQGKELKPLYLHCYFRNISKIWRAEN